MSVEILRENISLLEKGVIARTPQDHSKSNTWRKRNTKDGEIDWRMGSKRIYDLARALAKPYVGVHFNLDGKDIKIWKVRVVKNMESFENIEPGKVLSVKGRTFLVKTGDGVVEVLEHESDQTPSVGEYL